MPPTPMELGVPLVPSGTSVDDILQRQMDSLRQALACHEVLVHLLDRTEGSFGRVGSNDGASADSARATPRTPLTPLRSPTSPEGWKHPPLGKRQQQVGASRAEAPSAKTKVAAPPQPVPWELPQRPPRRTSDPVSEWKDLPQEGEPNSDSISQPNAQPIVCPPVTVWAPNMDPNDNVEQQRDVHSDGLGMSNGSVVAEGHDLTEPLLPRVDSPSRGKLLEVPSNNVPQVQRHYPQLKLEVPSNGSLCESSDCTPSPAVLGAKKPLFPSAGAGLKARVLAALQKPEYRVEALYNDSGMCAKMASNDLFQNFTLLVIVLNTIWIAIETDHNKAPILVEAPLIFQVVDNAFATFFTFEILVRFFAFKQKLHALQDGWFIFDGLLVLLMVWETWISVALYVALDTTAWSAAGHSSILRILRIFRLTRVARVTRLLRGIPELMILVKGMYEGIRSVSATMLLLMLIIYIFAVLFTQLLAGTKAGAGCFDNVPEAMNCLLLQGVFSDQMDFINQLLSADWKYYVFILFYLTFVSLTVMNMLIAVLCEVVSVVAQVDKEENSLRVLKSKISDVLQSLGVRDGSQEVSKEHFIRLTDNPEAMRSLHDVGVDVVALVELSDFLFHEEDSLALSQFVELVLQFRGSNTATVKDIVDMRSFLRRELVDLEERMMRENRKRRGSLSFGAK